MNQPELPQLQRVDPELSIVMPCYNEEEVLPLSIPPFLKVFEESKVRYELVLVNNGSWDGTPRIIDSFIAQGYPVRRVDVAVNQGFGWGIICGLKEARGEYIGYMACDGQTRPEDVLLTYQAIKGKSRGIVAKVNRTRRDDGWQRLLMSKFFNFAFYILFGAITPDVNGIPKIFHRDDLRVLNPTGKDSFIDPELMIKSKALNFNIIEIPSNFYVRKKGSSSVKVISKGFEFLGHMLRFRLERRLEKWLTEVKKQGNRW